MDTWGRIDRKFQKPKPIELACTVCGRTDGEVMRRDLKSDSLVSCLRCFYSKSANEQIAEGFKTKWPKIAY